MATMNRWCETCGEAFWQGRGRPARRCPRCRDGDRYGVVHRATRAATITTALGKACARCGQIMLEGQAVELDHDDRDPTRYVGYSHRSCNARAGAIAGNKARAAAYRAAKGLPSPNGITRTRVQENPPAPYVRRCKRTREEINAAPELLPCICGALTSGCW